MHSPALQESVGSSCTGLPAQVASPVHPATLEAAHLPAVLQVVWDSVIPDLLYDGQPPTISPGFPDTQLAVYWHAPEVQVQGFAVELQ